MRFSIIVPVYNCAQYIKQCLDSILCQTYSDFEVIIIDDGSNDGSSLICDRWADAYDNIKVILKYIINQSDIRT